MSLKKNKNWEKSDPSVKKNYIYNLIYQVLTLLTPFITTPYISRILGAEGTGVQSYTNSVVQYFAILAALGTASYGQREIARHRDNKEERSRLFWEIELLCAVTTAACLVVWMGVIGFSQAYRPYYAVLTLTLAAVALDISWFFGGLERYGLIVLRNLIIKAAGILMLFVFIKSREDLLLYVALIAATGFLGNLSMWGYLRHFLVKVDFKRLSIKRHFKETLVYFVPTIATSVYTILDKTMLGWFTGDDKTQNGYYEYATGFVNMAKILILSYNAVVSARMSYLFAEERMEEIHRRAEESLSFVMLLAVPMAVGLAAISPGFVPWFLGPGYEPVIQLLYVCSPLVLVVGLSDCMGSLILTPSGQRAKSGKVIVAGSAVNFILNLLAIPRFGAAGAAGASVAAEVFITCMYLYLCRGYIGPRLLAACSVKRLAAAAVMFAAVRMLGDVLAPGPLMTFGQVCAGAAVYFLLLFFAGDGFLRKSAAEFRRRLGRRA